VLAHELLNRLKKAGCEVRVDGETIKVRGGALTDDLRQAIRQNKPHLLAYLQEQAINTLLIKTHNRIKPCQFTKEPLTWAVEHDRRDISYALFEAEVNFSGAVLGKRIDEASHWADRLAAAWERLYASSRAVS